MDSHSWAFGLLLSCTRNVREGEAPYLNTHPSTHQLRVNSALTQRGLKYTMGQELGKRLPSVQPSEAPMLGADPPTWLL